MPGLMKSFLADQCGATAIEYALIAGTMATVLIAAFAALSTDITAAFTRISAAVK